MSDPNADGFGLKNGQMSHHYADGIGPQRPLCTIHNDDENGQWELWHNRGVSGYPPERRDWRVHAASAPRGSKEPGEMCDQGWRDMEGYAVLGSKSAPSSSPQRSKKLFDAITPDSEAIASVRQCSSVKDQGCKLGWSTFSEVGGAGPANRVDIPMFLNI
ncbi:hypothetical protein B0H13DRAFT_1905912 [Mycena leptocephala]|nr:hypothetical protein B0H13DRAFT_1905912 [Mycena leptocephala]